MFRRLFWIIIFLCGYFWVMTSDQETIMTRAKTLYKLCMNAMDAEEVELHIHTAECFKDTYKDRRR